MKIDCLTFDLELSYTFYSMKALLFIPINFLFLTFLDSNLKILASHSCLILTSKTAVNLMTRI